MAAENIAKGVDILGYSGTLATSPPGGFQAAPGDDVAEVLLSWADSYLVSGGYLIVRSGDALSAEAAVPIDGTEYTNSSLINGDNVVYAGTATSYTDTTINFSTPYYYSIYLYSSSFVYSDGYTVNVTVVPPSFPSCKDQYNAGTTESGVYSIDPDGGGGVAGFDTYCENSLANGGWTLAYRFVASATDTTTRSVLAGDSNVSAPAPGNNQYSSQSYHNLLLDSVSFTDYMIVYSQDNSTLSYFMTANCPTHSLANVTSQPWVSGDRYNCSVTGGNVGYSYFKIASSTNLQSSADCSQDAGDSVVWGFFPNNDYSSSTDSFDTADNLSIGISDSECSPTSSIASVFGRRSSSYASDFDSPLNYNSHSGQETTGVFLLYIR